MYKYPTTLHRSSYYDVINILAIFSHRIFEKKNYWQRRDLNLRRRFFFFFFFFFLLFFFLTQLVPESTFFGKF